MRTIFGLAALVAAVGGVVFMATDGRDQDEKRSLEYFEKLGGRVFCSDEAPELFKKHLVKDFGKVYFVILSETKVQDDDLEKLKSLGTIAVIKLNFTSISDKGLNLLGLADLSTLFRLELFGSKISDEGSGFFRKTTFLTHLDVGATYAGDKCVEEIASACNRLEVLELSETKVTDKSIPLLARLKRLKRLDLSGTGVTNAGAKVLQGLPDLKVLSLSNSKVSVGIGRILSQGNATIEDIDLGGTEIDDSDLSELAKIESLVRLDLRNTNITDRGVMALAAKRSLRSLGLGNTKVTVRARDFLKEKNPDISYQSLPYVDKEK